MFLYKLSNIIRIVLLTNIKLKKMSKSMEGLPLTGDNGEEKETPFPVDYFLRQGRTKTETNTSHESLDSGLPPEFEPRQGEGMREYLDRQMVYIKAPKDVDAKSWREAHDKVREEMMSFLNGLKGSISKRIYHDSFARIQNFSNSDIVKIILESSQVDWISNPAYYTALSEEMDLRVNATF